MAWRLGAQVLAWPTEGGEAGASIHANAFEGVTLKINLSPYSGKPVVYQNLPQAEFEAVLISVGLPAGLAALLADSDAAAAKGALFDETGGLGRLIGRGTTPVAESLG